MLKECVLLWVVCTAAVFGLFAGGGIEALPALVAAAIIAALSVLATLPMRPQ